MQLKPDPLFFYELTKMPTPLNLMINGSEQVNGNAVGRCKLKKQL